MELFLTESTETQSTNELQTFKSDICFCDVAFGYKEQSLILSVFNLTIKKGKRYLIQGPSGCGKTTAVNLLLRYYDFHDTLRNNLTMYHDIAEERLL